MRKKLNFEKIIYLSIFLVKTAIISGPSDVNVTQNQEVFLQCHANGIPQPTINWYKTEETESIENETQLATFGNQCTCNFMLCRNFEVYDQK